jgi:hypothetical protein
LPAGLTNTGPTAADGRISHYNLLVYAPDGGLCFDDITVTARPGWSWDEQFHHPGRGATTTVPIANLRDTGSISLTKTGVADAGTEPWITPAPR